MRQIISSRAVLTETATRLPVPQPRHLTRIAQGRAPWRRAQPELCKAAGVSSLTLLAEGAINQARYAVYIAACAILWRTIARKTPYCRATAASFAPTEPTEMNQAQVAKSKRRAMNRLASPSAPSKAAQA